MSSETEVGHARIVESIVSAVRDGDLEKVKELLNQYGLSFCPSLVEGYILLCLALDKNHLRVSKVLLDKGAKVNCESNQTSLYLATFGWNPAEHAFDHPSPPSVAYKLVDKYTPLHLACENTHSDWDQSELVDLLVTRGADVNSKTVETETPLHFAAASCKAEIVETLIYHGAQVDFAERRNNYTPLHIACQRSQGTIVEMLLTSGADVNAKAKDGVTPLHLAVKDFNSEITEILINHGADIHCVRLSDKYTPLHVASASNSDAVDVLLENGADPNAKAVDNLSPLHLAAEHWSAKAIVALSEHGAQVNSQTLCDNYTPLHVACNILEESAAVCKLLLENGADPNIRSKYNVTPMHLAAQRGHLNVLETLIKHGAEVNCTRLSDNYTPLLIACVNRDSEVVDMLLSNGVDPNALTRNNSNPLHLIVKEYYSLYGPCDTLKMYEESDKILESLIKHGTEINWPRSSDNFTPLHVASEASYGTEAVKQLLESGADPNIKARDDITPLHLATERAHWERIELLLKHGAIVNSPRLSDHCTPFHLACEDGYSEGASLLLSHGADPDAKSKNNENSLHFILKKNCSPRKLRNYLIKLGTQVNCSRLSDSYTPLHLACSRVSKDAVFELLKSGADPNIKANDDVTPLHLAVKEYDLEIVELLLKYGSQINTPRLSDNKTPLYIACEESKETHVSVLLKKGADPNIKANDGSTPLFAAMTAEDINSIETVKNLINQGAEINCARPSDGYTPLHVACDMNWPRGNDTVDILLENGADPNVSAHNSTTPLHIAAQRGNHSTVKKLLNKFVDINVKTGEGLTALDLVSQNNRGDQMHQPPIGALNRRRESVSLDLLKMHAILLKVAGLYVSENNLKFIQQDDLKLQAFQLECEKEIEEMKCKIVSDLFTVYDVLRYRQNPLYAREESLMESLKSFDYKDFPNYESLFLKCLEQSKQRIELLPAGLKALDALIKTSCILNESEIPVLLVEIQREIVSYFSNQELKMLVSFGEDLKNQFSKFSGNPETS